MNLSSDEIKVLAACSKEILIGAISRDSGLSQEKTKRILKKLEEKELLFGIEREIKKGELITVYELTKKGFDHLKDNPRKWKY